MQIFYARPFEGSALRCGEFTPGVSGVVVDDLTNYILTFGELGIFYSALSFDGTVYAVYFNCYGSGMFLVAFS